MKQTAANTQTGKVCQHKPTKEHVCSGYGPAMKRFVQIRATNYWTKKHGKSETFHGMVMNGQGPDRLTARVAKRGNHLPTFTNAWIPGWILLLGECSD
jgi:hypothetical protein